AYARKTEEQATQSSVLPENASVDGAEDFDSLSRLIDERLKNGCTDLYEDVTRRLDRLLLTRVLKHTEGNELQAGKLLGITRGRPRTKIRSLGITISRVVQGQGEGQETKENDDKVKG